MRVGFVDVSGRQPPLRPLAAAPLRPLVKEHGKHDDQADDDLLVVGRHVEQRQAVTKHPNQQNTDDCAEYGAFTTKETGTANHDAGDDGQFKPDTGHLLGRVKTGGKHETREAGKETASHRH